MIVPLLSTKQRDVKVIGTFSKTGLADNDIGDLDRSMYPLDPHQFDIGG
jgi:hypothetical protein